MWIYSTKMSIICTSTILPNITFIWKYWSKDRDWIFPSGSYIGNTILDFLTFLKFEHFHATNKLICLSNFSSKITNLTLENDHVCSIQTTEHNYCLTNLHDRISKYSSVSCRICICTFFFEHNTKEWGRIIVNCK